MALRLRRLSIILIVFLVTGGWLMAPNVSAQDATWTTTADFDDGMKSEPGDGNWGVETLTDNLGIPSGAFELSSMKSDTFSFADSDADTFKWTRITRASLACTAATETREIIDGNLSLSLTSGSSACQRGIMSKTTVTGDFDIRIYIDRITQPSNTQLFMFALVNENIGWCDDATTADGIEFRWQAGTPPSNLQAITCVNSAVAQVGTNTLVSEPQFLRVTRVNSSYTWYYSSDGTTWTQDETTTDADIAGPMYVQFYLFIASVTTTISARFDNFHVETGLVSFRTTGYWQSPTLPIPSNRRIDRVEATLDDAGEWGYIDRMEFRLNGSVVQESDENIQGGTSHTYNAEFVHSGLANFNFRLYLAGAGNMSVMIEQIEVYLAVINPLADGFVVLLGIVFLLMVLTIALAVSQRSGTMFVLSGLLGVVNLAALETYVLVGEGELIHYGTFIVLLVVSIILFVQGALTLADDVKPGGLFHR